MRIAVLCPSVTLNGTPLDSETVWTGEPSGERLISSIGKPKGISFFLKKICKI